jgi:hypothetical protein
MDPKNICHGEDIGQTYLKSLKSMRRLRLKIQYHQVNLIPIKGSAT